MEPAYSWDGGDWWLYNIAIKILGSQKKEQQSHWKNKAMKLPSIRLAQSQAQAAYGGMNTTDRNITTQANGLARCCPHTSSHTEEPLSPMHRKDIYNSDGLRAAMYLSHLDDGNSRKQRALLLGLTPGEGGESSFTMNQSYPRLESRRLITEPMGALWRRKNLQSLSEKAINTASFTQRAVSSSFSRLGFGECCPEGLVVRNPNKGVLTVDGKTKQILTCNDMACRMFDLPEEHLIGRRLTDVCGDLGRLKNRPSILDESLGELFAKNVDLKDELQTLQGKVTDIVDSGGVMVPVAVWLSKLKPDHHHSSALPLDQSSSSSISNERWMMSFEPVEKTSGHCLIDSKGRIFSSDKECAHLFGYGTTGPIYGMNIVNLIPSLNLAELTQDVPKKVYLTGRSAHGFSFPLTAKFKRKLENDYVDVTIDVYSTISGLITISSDGHIRACNHQFTSLMFGYSQETLLGKNISTIIPRFHLDTTIDRFSTVCSPVQAEPSMIAAGSPTSDISTAAVVGAGERCLTPDLIHRVSTLSLNDDNANSAIATNSALSTPLSRLCQKHRNTPLGGVCEFTFASPADPVSEKCSPFPASSAATTVNGRLTSTPRSGGGSIESLTVTKKRTGSALSTIISEGSYWSQGRHSDGSLIGIGYEVRHVPSTDTYCVWIVRDPEDVSAGHYSYSLNWTPVAPTFIVPSESKPHSDKRPSQAKDDPSSFHTDDCKYMDTPPVIPEYCEGEYAQKYHTLRHVGKGGFGYVKLAARKADNLLVITKFILKRSVLSDCWIDDITQGRKVPIEVSLLPLLHHDNIVKVLDVMENANWYQLVMEKHGSGMDLFEFIDRQPNLDEPLSAYMFRQIVLAVSYLHQKGIVHRDIKDENVIVDHRFTTKLIDFGSAAFIEPGKMFSTFCGTAEYCSPEVLLGNTYAGPELEVWSLGVLLYTLVFQENPFYDADEAIHADLCIPWEISDGLFHLLSWMLHPLPSERALIDDISEHWWVQQPSDPTRYKFERVLNFCDPSEVNPPRYLDELTASDRRNSVASPGGPHPNTHYANKTM